jgi:hypothetical protein
MADVFDQALTQKKKQSERLLFFDVGKDIKIYPSQQGFEVRQQFC